MVDHASTPLVVTAGEPAGIGPDLCLAIVANHRCPMVVVADPSQLAMRADRLSLDVSIVNYEPGHYQVGAINVLPIDLPVANVCGRPDPDNSATILSGLERAVRGCQSGEFRALVTGPLQKSAINDAGIGFSGHTEFIAALTDVEMPVMLLVADQLRVALATTHLPLRKVADAITENLILDVARILHRDLVRWFGIAKPEIIVCGLNPHAGEGGHLGHEDAAIIGPAIERLQAEGIRVRGPLPADTAFTPAAGHADAILAMYHDQGLPVLKYAGFGHAVNVTLGLPIIRTSVDHGTALDIAGLGAADPGSFLAAIELAARMSRR